MLDPVKIISWLESFVNGMRRSRLKTLAALAHAALSRCGVGVLSLGRCIAGPTSAKHSIKRVWRFLRNGSVETEAVHEALFKQAARAPSPLVVLVDWTDLHPYRILVMAVACDGRALPFWSRTIVQGGGRGQMKSAEAEAVEFLARQAGKGGGVVVVGDRGFGNARWLGLLRKHGIGFVQRLSKGLTVFAPGCYCRLGELDVRRGDGPQGRGVCTLGEKSPFRARLVTLWQEDAREPWYLVASIEGSASAIQSIYKQRMWIEAMFRDLKSRKLGFGLSEVRLSEPQRHDRHLLVIFLAYYLLCAYGAEAESRGLDRAQKANTVSERVLSLATTGFLALKNSIRCSIKKAVRQLLLTPT
jgi:hypothetical protein